MSEVVTAHAVPEFGDPKPSYVKIEDGPAPSTLTVGELLRVVAAEAPDRIALSEPTGYDGACGSRWSYAELLARAEQGARALRQQLAPGEHVTVWAGNSPEWVIVQYAASLAGIVLVAANPGLRKAEISYALSQADSVGIIYNRRYRDVDAEQIVGELSTEMPELRFKLAIDDWHDFVATADPDTELPTTASTDPVMIQYTSGTTGKPKAAVLPHLSIVNCGRFAAEHLALDRPPIWYMASPLFHTGGCVFGVLGTLWQRGTLVIPAEFDGAQMLHSVAHDGVIGATMTPTMCLRVLQAFGENPVDITNLEIIVGGGAPVAPELVRRLGRELGAEFLMVYGQTETGSAVTMSRRDDDIIRRTETVGRVFPHLEARIADPIDGHIVAFGEQGEIQLRGHMAFSGYVGMPEESAKTLDAHGWVHTGDLGALSEDGYLSVTGRLKNVIIRGGEKIYPREVEDVLAAHPDVTDSAVFGVPDHQWGEVVVAAVIPAGGAELDAPALISWLRSRIARYKAPEHIMFVPHFPTTPSGKIQTFLLQDKAIQDRSASLQTSPPLPAVRGKDTT